MFEFWFYGVKDPQDPESSKPFNHHGGTTDFLEVCCQITKFFSPGITGDFATAFFKEKLNDLDFLRIEYDWKFEFDWGTDQKITLHKVR